MDRLPPKRLEAILEAARGVRILVVGDLMLDRYVSGSVERISPEAPVPVVHVVEESHAVGGAANVASNVVSLGASCHVVGCVGRDEGAELLRHDLEAVGVDTRGVVVAEERPTTVKTRVLALHQQVVRVDREMAGDVSPPLAGELSERVRELARDCDVLVMEDYNKGVLVPAVIETVRQLATADGRPTVADPKRLNFFAYEGVTVFKPNRKELADALSDHVHPDDPAWMEATRRRLGCANLLLTLGERGVALQTSDGSSVRIPAVARDIYDVSGAGDTVTAATAVALGAGATVTEAAILANHAAAIEVGKPGVVPVSADQIRKHYRAFMEEP